MWNFQSVLVGPHFYYMDYMRFIDGSNFKVPRKVYQWLLMALIVHYLQNWTDFASKRQAVNSIYMYLARYKI